MFGFSLLIFFINIHDSISNDITINCDNSFNCSDIQTCKEHNNCEWNCFGQKSCQLITFECQYNSSCIINCGNINTQNKDDQSCINSIINATNANQLIINGNYNSNELTEKPYANLYGITVYCPNDINSECILNYYDTEYISNLTIYSIYGFNNTKIYGSYNMTPISSYMNCGSDMCPLSNQIINNSSYYWQCNNNSCLYTIPQISTLIPTNMPTQSPTNNPTNIPSNIPTNYPSNIPSKSPTTTPTNTPTNTPTIMPTPTPITREAHSKAQKWVLISVLIIMGLISIYVACCVLAKTTTKSDELIYHQLRSRNQSVSVHSRQGMDV